MTKKPLLLKAIKLIVLSITFATNAANAQKWEFAYQVLEGNQSGVRPMGVLNSFISLSKLTNNG